MDRIIQGLTVLYLYVYIKKASNKKKYKLIMQT